MGTTLRARQERVTRPRARAARACAIEHPRAARAGAQSDCDPLGLLEQHLDWLARLAAALIVGIQREFTLFYQRGANVFTGEQAYAYLLGAEELASLALLLDYDADRQAAKEMKERAAKDAWYEQARKEKEERFELVRQHALRVRRQKQEQFKNCSCFCLFILCRLLTKSRSTTSSHLLGFY